MKLIITALTSLAIVIGFSGCSGASKNEWKRTGVSYECGDFKVTSQGKEWTIHNSYVNTETQSDGWFFFTDGGKLVRLSGNVIIEQL